MMISETHSRNTTRAGVLPEVVMRVAEASDLAMLATLERACFAEPWSQSILEETLRAERTFVVVAEQEGRICGYATAWVVLDEAELSRVAVLPDARGQGIGIALTQAVMQECVAAGARHVFLEVRDSNTAARRLYERCGFAAVGMRPRYYHNGENAVQMKWSRQESHA